MKKLKLIIPDKYRERHKTEIVSKRKPVSYMPRKPFEKYVRVDACNDDWGL